jgi:hypothetical protein
MARYRVTFHQLRQDPCDYGSNDKYMVSRVFFSLEKDGKGLGDFSADLKQAVGSDVERSDIEVGPVRGYDGPFNQEGFSIAAKKYFRDLIGSKGAGIRAMAPRHILVRDNFFSKDSEFSF